MKCPKCGLFVSKVRATVNGLKEIVKVKAKCKRCGPVEPTDWDYETFFPEAE